MTNCTAELIADHDCPDCDPDTAAGAGTGPAYVPGEPPAGPGRWRTTPRHIAAVAAGLLTTVVLAALACQPTTPTPAPVPSPAPGPAITTTVTPEGAGGGISGGIE